MGIKASVSHDPYGKVKGNKIVNSCICTSNDVIVRDVWSIVYITNEMIHDVVVSVVYQWTTRE